MAGNFHPGGARITSPRPAPSPTSSTRALLRALRLGARLHAIGKAKRQAAQAGAGPYLESLNTRVVERNEQHKAEALGLPPNPNVPAPRNLPVSREQPGMS